MSLPFFYFLTDTVVENSKYRTILISLNNPDDAEFTAGLSAALLDIYPSLAIT